MSSQAYLLADIWHAVRGLLDIDRVAEVDLLRLFLIILQHLFGREDGR